MDLICFCHLRWNFVYQRPQHLMSRFAKPFRVIIIEEAIHDSEEAFLEITQTPDNIMVVVPHIPPFMSHEENERVQLRLLTQFAFTQKVRNYIAWFYTPMMLPLLAAFPSPALTVYDCMDELSAFKNAPQSLRVNEILLMEKADLVFTGGHSLYAVKKAMHKNIFAFPSSIDKTHFGKARSVVTEPADQAAIPHPRIGFFGVIDERLDIELIAGVARLRPDWHLVLIGPTVKIDPATLPSSPNIHYLGGKSYDELPVYLAGWDVAMIPFANNESTKFISPTKTPEYLAGGRPVISTPIADVVNPYHTKKLVSIASTPEEFVAAMEALPQGKKQKAWLTAVDKFLDDFSWDITWEKMLSRMNALLDLKKRHANKVRDLDVYELHPVKKPVASGNA